MKSAESRKRSNNEQVTGDIAKIMAWVPESTKRLIHTDQMGRRPGNVPVFILQT